MSFSGKWRFKNAVQETGGIFIRRHSGCCGDGRDGGHWCCRHGHADEKAVGSDAPGLRPARAPAERRAGHLQFFLLYLQPASSPHSFGTRSVPPPPPPPPRKFVPRPFNGETDRRLPIVACHRFLPRRRVGASGSGTAACGTAAACGAAEACGATEADHCARASPSSTSPARQSTGSSEQSCDAACPDEFTPVPGSEPRLAEQRAQHSNRPAGSAACGSDDQLCKRSGA